MAIAISCYSREGGSLDQKNFPQSEHVSSQIWCQKFFPLLRGGVAQQKNFFPVWTCIKPNLVSKIFPFTRRGPSTKSFFPVWTCIKPNLVSKIFPFTRGGGVPWEKFFFRSEHVSSQIWCQKFFPLLGGGPSTKNFFPVWTCIKPNLVSKIFLFTRGGGVPWQKIFFLSEHVSSQIWCQKFFPLLRQGTPPPPNLRPGTPPQKKSETLDPPPKSETWDPPFPKIWDLGPPQKIWDLGPPLENLRHGNPPPKVNRQTFPSINITFPRTTYAGGKNTD